jgi:hypothetical protein
MKVKVATAEGPVLDWMVAKCEGCKPGYYKGVVRATAHPDSPQISPMFGPELNYSTDPAQAYPIIEREKIATKENGYGHWFAKVGSGKWLRGPTPLIAAMRCYVVSKLGEEVDVPDELCGGTA